MIYPWILAFSRLNSLDSQPVFAGEVLQPSDHLWVITSGPVLTGLHPSYAECSTPGHGAPGGETKCAYKQE